MPAMPAPYMPTYPMRKYPYYPSFYPMATPMAMPWPMPGTPTGMGMGMTMTPAQTATPTKVEVDPATTEEMTDMTDLELEEQDEVAMEKRAADALLPFEITKTTP